MPPRIPDTTGVTNGTTESLLRPEQRRKLCTTILRKKPQPQVRRFAFIFLIQNDQNYDFTILLINLTDNNKHINKFINNFFFLKIT